MALRTAEEAALVGKEGPGAAAESEERGGSARVEEDEEARLGGVRIIGVEDVAEGVRVGRVKELEEGRGLVTRRAQHRVLLAEGDEAVEELKELLIALEETPIEHVALVIVDLSRVNAQHFLAFPHHRDTVGS